MKRWFMALLGAALALMTSLTMADSHVGDLVRQLGERDFRMRVHAALELGKSEGEVARSSLEQALGDSHASVRLAAATALEVLGNPAALPVLRAHKDELEAVRHRVEQTIESLEALERARRDATILVRLGTIKNATSVDAESALRYLRAQSRRAISQLPSVAVISGEPADDKPVVMLTGQVARLSAKREGAKVVYSAKVKYVVHRMPERAISAAVSGSAVGTTSLSEARDKRRAAEVRAAVLEAAVASAMRSVMPALEAAASR